MPWSTSDRREHLPPNWDSLRKRVFKRDGHQCTHRNEWGERCGEPAQECDHLGARDDHRLEMLTSLCTWHHGKKSGSQGGSASAKVRWKNAQKFKRVEEHPGLI